jgi:hypothetical protein
MWCHQLTEGSGDVNVIHLLGLFSERGKPFELFLRYSVRIVGPVATERPIRISTPSRVRNYPLPQARAERDWQTPLNMGKLTLHCLNAPLGKLAGVWMY